MKDTQKLPVILVDDTKEIRWCINETIKKQKIKPSQFSHPKSVIDYIQSTHIQEYILVTDFHMPSLTGVELVRCLIREQCAPKKTIIVSSRGREETEIQNALAELSTLIDVVFFEKTELKEFGNYLQSVLNSEVLDTLDSDER